MRLREAVIAAVTTGENRPDGDQQAPEAGAPTIATAAATLKSQLAHEDTPLSAPEEALLEQWLTTLADTPAGAPVTQQHPHR